MKRKRFTEEQIAFALRQAEAGTPVSSPRRGTMLSGGGVPAATQAFRLDSMARSAGPALAGLRPLAQKPGAPVVPKCPPCCTPATSITRTQPCDSARHNPSRIKSPPKPSPWAVG